MIVCTHALRVACLEMSNFQYLLNLALAFHLKLFPCALGECHAVEPSAS
jgi:hypothetical protein